MRKKKITLCLLIILTLLIIAIIGVVAYAFTDNTTELYSPVEKVEFFSEWQKYIKDDTKLNKIVTPGSHDAGCYDMMPLAKTQGHSIYDQLISGTRYFDVRVTDKGDDLVIFHGPIKGASFSTVLDDIKNFTTENPTEFIVIDFQHLGKDVNKKVLDKLTSSLDMNKAMKKSMFSTIENTTIGEIRNNNINYVIIWNNKEECDSNDYLYYRNDNLFSFYDGNVHRNPDAIVLIEHFPSYYERYENKGFFVLQSQKTASLLIDKPCDMEIKWGKAFTDFAKSLNTDQEKLDKTNIIMRDFIASDLNKVRAILKLNVSKNIVKEDSIEIFSNNVLEK